MPSCLHEKVIFNERYSFMHSSIACVLRSARPPLTFPPSLPPSLTLIPSHSGSGELEFEEFCSLAAKFLIEEDEEALKAELREAFRIYDKGGESRHGKGRKRVVDLPLFLFFTSSLSSLIFFSLLSHPHSFLYPSSSRLLLYQIVITSCVEVVPFT